MPNFDSAGSGNKSGGDGAERSELRVVLSTEGGIKLEDSRKEIKLLVTASDEAAKSLERSAASLSKAADQLVRVTANISKSGREATKVTQETAKALDTVATGAVLKGNLLATAVTALVRGSGNLIVGFLQTQAKFAGEVAEAFSDQTAQIVRQTEAYDRYSISLAAVLRDEERVRNVQRKAFKAGADSPFSIREFEDASQKLVRTPGTRELFFGAEDDVQKNTDRLFGLVSRLASTDPRLGVAGAVQAVRVGLQGQFRLLTRQYGISIGELVEVSGKSIKQLRTNSGALLEALETVSARNFPDAYVKQLTQLPSNIASNIKELTTTIIPREIGKAGFQDNVSALLDEVYQLLFDFAKPDGVLATKYAPRISDALSRTVAAMVKGAVNIVGGSVGENENPFEALFEGITYVADKLATYVENIAELTGTPEAQEFFKTFFEKGTEVFGKFVDSVFGFASFLPKLSVYIFEFATAVVSMTAQVVQAVSQGVAGIDKVLSSIPGSVGFDAGIRGRRRDAASSFKALGADEPGVSFPPAGAGGFDPNDTVQVGGAFQDYLKRGVASYLQINGDARLPLDQYKANKARLRKTVDDATDAIIREASRRALKDGVVDEKLAAKYAAEIRSQIDLNLLLAIESELGVGSAQGLFPFDAPFASLPSFPKPGASVAESRPSGATSRPSTKSLGDNFLDRFKLRRTARQNVSNPLDNLVAALISSGGEFTSSAATAEEDAYRGLQTPFERASATFDDTRFSANAVRQRGSGEFQKTFATLTDPGDMIQAIQELDLFFRRVASAESAKNIKNMNDAMKALTEIDPTNVGAFNRALTEIGDRFKEVKSIEGENGKRQFGIDGAASLGGAAFSRFGTALADRDVRDLTLFGSTPELQLRSAQKRLAFLRDENGIYGDLLDKQRDLFKVEEERAAFEAEIARLLGKQNEEVERLTRKTQFDLAKQKNPLVKGLDQLNLIKLDDETGQPRLKKATEQFEELGTDLGAGFITGFSSAVGDSLFNVFTGRFDDIRQVWQNLMESMIKIFTDFLGKLITSQLTQAFFGDSLSALTGGSIIPGGGPVSLDGYVGGAAIGGVYAVGGVATHPQYAMVGEGGSSELIAPLNRRGRLPLAMTGRGPAAVLPGGRMIPTEFMAGPTPNFGAAQRPIVNVVVLTDPREITARGLAANGGIVANVAAANIRNRGAIAAALTR